MKTKTLLIIFVLASFTLACTLTQGAFSGLPSPTATGTASPTPTVSMSPVPQAVVCTGVEGGWLHVRACAGTHCAQTDVLSEGAPVEVAEHVQIEDGSAWAYIQSPVSGWVNERYLCSERTGSMTTKIFAIANQKGGVAKTTTVVTVACALAQKGKRVLIGDFDPQGQCATALGMNSEPGIFNILVTKTNPRQWIRETGRDNLYLIPGDRSTATAQIVLNAENRPITAVADILWSLGKEFDYIIFDTAPSVGGLQERALYASGYVLIPTATEYLSSDGLSQILEMLKTLRARHAWQGKLLGILPTFYDDQTRESQETVKNLLDSFGDSVFSPIHRATILRECAADGRTIFEKAPKSRAAQEYRALVAYILKLT